VEIDTAGLEMSAVIEVILAAMVQPPAGDLDDERAAT